MQSYHLTDEFTDIPAEQALLASLAQSPALYWDLLDLLTLQSGGEIHVMLPPDFCVTVDLKNAYQSRGQQKPCSSERCVHASPPSTRKMGIFITANRTITATTVGANLSSAASNTSSPLISGV